MLLSVLAWSLVPVIFAVSGASSLLNSLLFVGVLNLIGAVAAALAYLWSSRRSRLRLVRPLVRQARQHPRIAVLMLLDGGLIVLSNAAFVWALGLQEDLLVTLIVESWPVLAALALIRHVGRFKRFTKTEAIVGFVAVIGLYLLVSSGSGLGFREFDVAAVAGAVVAAAAMAGTVVVNQKLLQEFQPGDINLSKTILLQTSRMVWATLISVVLLLATGVLGAQVGVQGDLALSPNLMLLAGAGGLLIVGSALLYSRAMQLTDRPFKTLLWFLAPLISITLLSFVTQSPLTKEIVVGGTLVVAANVLLDKKSEPSWTLASLVLGSTLCGFMVLTFPGLGEAQYFEHLQVLAAFYAIMQGFLLNRLWERRRQIADLDCELQAIRALPEREVAQLVERSSITDYAAYQNMEPSRQRLTSEISNYSEVLLLTLLGLATGVVAIAGRPETLLGSVNAFLIPVTIIYLLGLTWSLVLDKLQRVDLLNEVERSDALVGYASAVAIFVVFLGTIVYVYT